MKLPFQTFIFYFLAFYFINYSLLGQPKMDIKTWVLLQQIQKSKTHEYFNFSEVSMQEINSQQYLSVLVNLGKNSPEILNQPGFLVGGVAGNIASVRVQMAYLNSINNLQNDMQVCLAKKLSPNLDRAIFDARVDSVYQGIDLPQGYSGKNVFVGVLDWGFDFTHPNFYDTSLATNRIFAAWDQYKNGGTPAVGFSYGAEIVGEAALLSHGSDTSGVYGNATHGSHVAGIAA